MAVSVCEQLAETAQRPLEQRAAALCRTAQTLKEQTLMLEVAVHGGRRIEPPFGAALSEMDEMMAALARDQRRGMLSERRLDEYERVLVKIGEVILDIAQAVEGARGPGA